MIDNNEIFAWIRACKNQDCLHHVYLEVAAQLKDLGRPVPTVPVPSPGKPVGSLPMPPRNPKALAMKSAAKLPDPPPLAATAEEAKSMAQKAADEKAKADGAAIAALADEAFGAVPSVSLPGITQKGQAYLVPSSTGQGIYTVLLTPAPAFCSCPDHQIRGAACKHIQAAVAFAAAAVPFDHQAAMSAFMAPPSGVDHGAAEVTSDAAPGASGS